MRLDGRLLAGSPWLELVLSTQWQQRHELLRLEIPLAAPACRWAADTSGGVIERPATARTARERARWEVSAISWLASVGPGRGDGLAVLLDGPQGVSATAERLGVSLLRGPTWPDPGADNGWQRQRLALLPCPGAGGQRLRPSRPPGCGSRSGAGRWQRRGAQPWRPKRSFLRSATICSWWPCGRWRRQMARGGWAGAAQRPEPRSLPAPPLDRPRLDRAGALRRPGPQVGGRGWRRSAAAEALATGALDAAEGRGGSVVVIVEGIGEALGRGPKAVYTPKPVRARSTASTARATERAGEVLAAGSMGDSQAGQGARDFRHNSRQPISVWPARPLQ